MTSAVTSLTVQGRGGRNVSSAAGTVASSVVAAAERARLRGDAGESPRSRRNTLLTTPYRYQPSRALANAWATVGKLCEGCL